MNLILEYSYWLIVPCILLGAGYAFLLYFKDDFLAEINPVVRYLMFTFRFFLVTFLAMLLLSPMMQTIFNEEEKPILVILQDNSESVIPPDSIEFLKNYPNSILNLKNNLSDNFDVRFLLLGSQVRQNEQIDFRDKETDLSSVVNVLRAQFSGRNLAAVILSTDGLYNKASNPLYEFPRLNVPIHIIPLGDTTIKKDLSIASVRHNDLAILGNVFPLEVLLNSHDLKGETFSLKITKNKKIIHQKEIRITNDNFSKVESFYLEALVGGLHHYKVNVTVLSGENNISNNSTDFFVDIRDKREKILIKIGKIG